MSHSSFQDKLLDKAAAVFKQTAGHECGVSLSVHRRQHPTVCSQAVGLFTQPPQPFPRQTAGPRTLSRKVRGFLIG